MIFHQPYNSLGNFNYNIFVYNNTEYPMHFHKNMELIYVISGKLKCIVNGLESVVAKDEFVLFLPYDIHSMCPAEKDTQYWVLVFSEDFVPYFANNVQGKTSATVSFKCCTAVEDMFKNMLLNCTEPTVYTMKACLYAICGEYMKNAVFTETNNKKQTIAAITDYISQNYTNDIALKDVAKLLGYNYNYVSRFFHNVFNMSFSELVNQYRLEDAVILLKETDQKIAEIAFASGFQSVRSFNNCFRKNYGVSPSDYRK